MLLIFRGLSCVPHSMTELMISTKTELGNLSCFQMQLEEKHNKFGDYTKTDGSNIIVQIRGFNIHISMLTTTFKTH